MKSSASAHVTGQPARTGYVDAGQGVQLFYRIVGAGSETLVVLHGGPGFSMDYLADDLAPLAQRHTLLCYDQRGTGKSSLASGAAALDAQRFVDDLEAVRQHFGLERLNLLGHSWGAGLAALYAQRYPQRVARLLIVGGIPLRRSELARTFQGIADKRSAEERARLLAARDAWLADPGSASACRAYYSLWYLPFYVDPAAASRSKGDFCSGSPAALRNKVENVDKYTMASLGEYDWRQALHAVTAPSLVIHGTADVIAVENAREWVAALPNGTLVLLEGVGHFPYVEAPEAFFTAVERFIEDHPSPLAGEGQGERGYRAPL
jgi:proline iminopeptidase